ncbi:hypothetical protein SPSIL_057970 [Sporomusa silvacetica DSM 10669]|uniref:ERF superfamily protein n=1 Tax=Sporomusa silvacetica DSM 10669 TaxID=1123289 RepID=A0ABZ3IVM0_9FIRM|nr:ERF family protein [Sporomusa silvacetica]OZC14255.1 ERF superfamily protein [Sporomusa silvacetica DSM 10669]
MKQIAGKLVKVMEACSTIKKNGINDFHHYKYATSADVLEKVNASLVKHNIASIVLPEVIANSDVMNNKGNIEHLVIVKVNITLIDTDSGEQIELSGIGSGQDSGDKAVMKAQTAAIKYAYMLSLAISTNDDPEADRKTDEGMYVTDMEKSPSGSGNLICSDCGTKITAGIMKVSMNRFGRQLCINCQKKLQGVA